MGSTTNAVWCAGHKLIIAVDPGFGGTGVCMLTGDRLYRFTNVKSGEKGDARYADIASKCARNVLCWISDLRASARYREETYVSTVDVVIESPHAMGGQAGHASLMRGDVFTVAKLAGSIGTLLSVYTQSLLDEANVAHDDSSDSMDKRVPVVVHVHYPEVRLWKGQVSKETTQRRVLRDVKYALNFIKERNYKLSEKYPDHVFDAVGLGMWFFANRSLYEN